MDIEQKVKLKPLHIMLATVAILIIGMTSGYIISKNKEDTIQSNIKNVQVEEIAKASIALDNGIEITNIGSYTGPFLEDGTDEQVSNVMMITVRNTGDEYIQYAEIDMPLSIGNASFSVSTLAPGMSIILLEQNRKLFDAKEKYDSAVVKNVAVFYEPVTMYEDKLYIQPLDGALNITNVSGSDIAGDIYIYYKNYSGDMYYGGITYRARIENGIETEEIRQVMTKHFSENDSRIMFVTIVGE